MENIFKKIEDYRVGCDQIYDIDELISRVK